MPVGISWKGKEVHAYKYITCTSHSNTLISLDFAPCLKILNNMEKSDSNVNVGAKVVGAPLQVIGGGEYRHPHEFIHIYKHKERTGTVMRIKR